MILKGAGTVGMSFPPACALYKTVISFSYMCSIGRHEEQNIFKFDLAVFSLKHKVWNLTVVGYVVFCCLVFLTCLMLSLQLSSPFIYFLLFVVPSEMVDWGFVVGAHMCMCAHTHIHAHTSRRLNLPTV